MGGENASKLNGIRKYPMVRLGFLFWAREVSQRAISDPDMAKVDPHGSTMC
jgi:hypothetical protein